MQPEPDAGSARRDRAHGPGPETLAGRDGSVFLEQERLRNIKLVLEYDGANLAGWQRQPDRETVQGLLEDALYRIIGEKITVIGAGRTDAGVHARGQTANFKTS